ncbi:hypothetical protein ACWC5C_38955 [Streptomyces sp. NPDC001700]
MSEDDDAPAAEASLRKAVEALSGDGAGEDSEAVQKAVRALSDGAEQEWTPEQERQIRAMVEQIRKVRELHRPGAGWWRRRRQWRAKERLVDLMMAGGPEMLNEAELRHWKNHMMVEVLLQFSGSAMKPEDVQLATSRMETVHATTHEDLQRLKQKHAERRDGPHRP